MRAQHDRSHRPSDARITDSVALTARWIAAARARDRTQFLWTLSPRRWRDQRASTTAGGALRLQPLGRDSWVRVSFRGRVAHRVVVILRCSRSIRTRARLKLINRYVTIPSTRSYNYGADDFMVTGTMAGASQVVLLAAGMDSRAFRLRIPPTTKVFELDKQALFDIKEPILHAMKAQPACQRVVIPVDLATEDWENHLVEAGFNWCGPKWKH